MDLFTQFQVFIGSILFGAGIIFSWSLFNRAFYSKKLYLIRYVLEPLFFMLWAFMYFRFLLSYSRGILSVFYPFAIALGVYIYYRFYAYHVDYFIEDVANVLDKKVYAPLRLKEKKLFAIMKASFRGIKIKHGKKFKKSKK